MGSPDNLCVLLVFAFAVPPLAEHDRSVHVGRGEGVGLVEQRDHAEQDCPGERRPTKSQDITTSHMVNLKYKKLTSKLWSRGEESDQQAARLFDGVLPDVLGGVPPFRGQLPALRVIHRGMQDGDAHISILKRDQ